MDIGTFQKTEKLFHYTSISSALKIIDSNSLRFGSLKNMNDINEAYRNIFYADGVDEDAVNEELQKYRQISLTKDGSNQRGYNIPAMWGHYAEKGNGACIVFDKSILLSSLQGGMSSDNVLYVENFDGDIHVKDSSNISSFFQSHVKEIFFTKTKDWSYENEYRILLKTNSKKEKFLSCQNSIMAVILNYAEDVNYLDSVFNSFNARLFECVFPKVLILELGSWFGKPNLRDKDGNDWE